MRVLCGNTLPMQSMGKDFQQYGGYMIGYAIEFTAKCGLCSKKQKCSDPVWADVEGLQICLDCRDALQKEN